MGDRSQESGYMRHKGKGSWGWSSRRGGAGGEAAGEGELEARQQERGSWR